GEAARNIVDETMPDLEGDPKEKEAEIELTSDDEETVKKSPKKSPNRRA
ncbi:MAG: hypothetical protein GY705_21965, partial [Bacteroidetes bacterium]|nr:hypothetical protein [Bacteroidota bacterium]